MKTTLWNAAHNTPQVLYSILDQKIPFLTARHVFKIASQLDNESTFLNTETDKIIDDMGAESDADGRFIVKNDDGTVNENKTKEFIDKVLELRNTEIEIDLEPFDESELESMEISPREYGMIQWMIKE